MILNSWISLVVVPIILRCTQADCHQTRKHGQRGEIRKRYRRESRRPTWRIGLVTNAVALLNTLYMESALNHIKGQCIHINEGDFSRLSQLLHSHINYVGHYSFVLTDLISKCKLRPLKIIKVEHDRG